MQKRLVVVLIILSLMCAGSFSVFQLAKDNNSKNNVEDDNNRGNKTISESKIINLLDNMKQDEYKVEDLTFKDVTVFVNEGKDSFEATLLSKKAREKLNLEIILYDRNKNKIKTLDFKFNDITGNDERILFCFVDGNLFDVYSFEVEVK